MKYNNFWKQHEKNILIHKNKMNVVYVITAVQVEKIYALILLI